MVLFILHIHESLNSCAVTMTNDEYIFNLQALTIALYAQIQVEVIYSRRNCMKFQWKHLSPNNFLRVGSKAQILHLFKEQMILDVKEKKHSLQEYLQQTEGQH